MRDYCQYCDYDAHVCPGCGTPVAHDEGACEECIIEAIEEGEY